MLLNLKHKNEVETNFVVHFCGSSALLTIGIDFSFSIRVFSVAAVICTILVLPVNYYGRDRKHKNIPFESLEVFTIENVKEGSEWYEAVTLF